MAVSSPVAGSAAVAVCVDDAGAAEHGAGNSSLQSRSSAAMCADAAPEADDRTRALAAVLAVGVLRLLVAGRGATPQSADTSALVPLVDSSKARSSSLAFVSQESVHGAAAD